MATNMINTRIQLKYDSLENWARVNTALKQGEVAIAYLPPKGTGVAPAATSEAVLMKVGPGNFNDLPWLSALAADVYAWAKATEAEHIEWLKTNHADNDTTYSFEVVDGKLQVTETPHVNGVAGAAVVKSYDFVTPSELTDILNNYYTKEEVNTITGDLSELNTTVKTSLVAAINEALQAVEVGGSGSIVTITKEATPSSGSHSTYVLKQGGNAVGDKIEIPVGLMSIGIDGQSDALGFSTDAEGKVTATFRTDDSGNVKFSQTASGLRGTVDLSHNHDDEYKKIQNPVANQNLTGATVISGVAQDGQGVISVSTREITAADLGLASAMHFIGAFVEAPEKAFAGTANERDLADGDVYLNTANHTEYVYSAGKWVELGNEGSHALKSITITGDGYLTGGGSLEANRTIDIADAVKTKIDNGATAYSWGDHASAGYAKDADLAKVIDGTTPVAKATNAENLGGQLPSYYATAESVTDITKNGGAIDSKISDYDASKNFGDIITHNIGEFATKAQGDKADSAVQTAKFTTEHNILEFVGSETTAFGGEGVTITTEGTSGVDKVKLGIADAAVTSAKIADNAIGVKHLKASADYNGDDAEIWVFNCGSATTVI